MCKSGWILITLSVVGVSLLVACGGGGGGGGGGVTPPDDTTPPADTTPPVVRLVTPSRVTTGSVVLEAEVTDEGGRGVKEVWLEAAGISQAVAMQPVSGKPNIYRAELTQETGRLRVRAVDGAGNTTISDWVQAPAPYPPRFE